MTECQSDHSNACLNIVEAYCVPQGSHFQNLENISNLVKCQKACSMISNCDFFSYQNSTQICEMFEGRNVTCELMIGHQYPSVEDCNDNVFIPTTTPTTTSTTTTTTTANSVLLSLTFVDSSNSSVKIKGAEIEANGIKHNTDQNGDVIFGPYEPDNSIEIHCKYFNYYDKEIRVDLANLEIFDGFANMTITMRRKTIETLLQLDLQYDPEKFDLMALNVIEVNNAYQATCHSTVRYVRKLLRKCRN